MPQITVGDLVRYEESWAVVRFINNFYKYAHVRWFDNNDETRISVHALARGIWTFAGPVAAEEAWIDT